jgi:hypothetical protein
MYEAPEGASLRAITRRRRRRLGPPVKWDLGYIGGVIPLRPTTTTAASQLPSAFFSHRGTKILVPGFRSALLEVDNGCIRRHDDRLPAVLVL